ncbi:hypothetical protein B0T24DRAFT_572793 [Lasiosphaeria ovina]|uniref:Uncharacterized protein n=1 Tax=Lasiosphaeria ovina TaxID=92902 RepID=A0AAE0KH62_9PEZI|nr:hypothetical protein B0T24DRAFT_572793 [Lasiosphaeria ovina]
MADIAAPKAKAGATVVVPMTLQAFLVANDFGDTAYQVAPLMLPDFSKLQQHETNSAGISTGLGEPGGDHWDHHDLMDRLDTSWWRLRARYSTRFRDVATGRPREGRSGVYLSWCLPRLYRSAITATESTISTPEGREHFQAKKLRSGFTVGESDDGNQPSQHNVQFRAVPDRWVVIRKVRAGGSSGTGSGKETWNLVESNCIRSLDDDDFIAPDGPDVEISTSPGMSPSDNAGQPLSAPSVMGRSAKLTPDNLAGAKKRNYRHPFNAFEMGHEFFVDYQPHNMGVFSFFDDLRDCVDDTTSEPATVDYAIIGFHSDARSDPFMLKQPLNMAKSDHPLKNEELLSALGLVLGDPGAAKDGKEVSDVASFAQTLASEDGRTLTYGVLRSVRFSRRSANHLSAPSITLQEEVFEHQPVAVGLHTLDALAAFLYVSLGGPKNTSAAVHTFLSQLVMLVARDDDVDSQRKAADEVAGHSWVASKEDTLWRLPQKGEGGDEQAQSFIVTDEHRDQLLTLNALQRQCDTCVREEEQLLHQLYGCWWNACGLRKLPADVLVSRRGQVKRQAGDIGKRFHSLSQRKNVLKLEIETAKTGLEKLLGVEKKLIAAPARPFGRHQDPTILVAGAKSGWPPAFDKPLPVRLASEVAPSTAVPPAPSEAWLDGILPNLAEPLKPLLREFSLVDEAARRSATWDKSPYAGLEDMQDVQGWFPLFIEWELEYYHIPFSKWIFEPSDELSGRWRWVIPPKTNLAQDPLVGTDCRRIHGRTAFVPEAAMTLRSRLDQLFAQTTDPDLLKVKEDVLNRVSAMGYFSAPLSGFTDQLLTLRRGHHPLPAATSASGDLEILEMLGLEPVRKAILDLAWS